MKFCIWFCSLLTVCGAHASGLTLYEVRQLIEKKDVDKAVSSLHSMYPKQFSKDEDVARVGKWLSVFLYDDTVAFYEKAVELAAKGESAAYEQLQKAKEKEPHNKTVRQTLLAYLIEQDKKSEAIKLLEESQKLYPYFKIYQAYALYMTGAGTGDKKKDLKLCATGQFSKEEKDFCKFTLLRDFVAQKSKADAKRIEEAKSLAFPDTLFLLWEMTSSTEYLKQYITKCQGLTEQEKRSARLFPGICSKVKDVEPLLKTEDPEE